MRDGTTYALAALFATLAVTAYADLFADFQNGKIDADFPIRTHGCDNNPRYKGSHRLLEPNRSYIEGTVTVKKIPARAVLTLKHRSVRSDQAKFKGRSPISIMVNGQTVVREFDPGHRYTRDSFEIAKYLHAGGNIIRIRFGAGTTHYWIKWMLIETD